jgi:hypothetical protein
MCLSRADGKVKEIQVFRIVIRYLHSDFPDLQVHQF